MKLKEKLKLIIDDLKKYNPEKIVLFGSAARGDTDEYSDIDLLVIKDDVDKGFIDREVEVITYIRPELRPVDIFVYTKDELEKMKKNLNTFIEEALKCGKVIYEKT